MSIVLERFGLDFILKIMVVLIRYSGSKAAPTAA